ncbi:hypothetical protein DF107_26385 [Burkholderia stagnalis]|uniref:Type III secretion protein n=1 Tax=Burkholderia stagnalis TaxID=1503054 RepID=A0A6L3MK32_9BURK|nr:hypothetical protein [Burkholderia stagnalis]KAB0630897.1 hypothetical protein F7R25_37050 [Burkholderia stagnalis]KVN06033.1 hypothetical protein WT07_05455 [Burkholderia stagnalis]KVO50878.1 hypothetical protein WT17_33895 [Burkholderia stagnalis]KVO69069.1 hypothetical protein WT19_20735 [Burkholderia stagnalis]KVW60409.1 hypothetical protein WT28_19165 [Burkholderia stagnalis]
MSVTGVGAPGAAALASGAQQQAGAASDPAQVRQFDALMQPGAPAADASAAHASGASARAAQVRPDAAPAVRMTPAQANASSLVERLRTYGNDLDARYANIDRHRTEMLTSMADNRSDPLMTMVKAMDFQWTATTTISEYQLSLSVAQAANGFTHTVLKTQE